MNAATPDDQDQLEELLTSCDEALAAGFEPSLPGAETTQPELLERLEQGLASMRLLRQHFSVPHSALQPEPGLALTHVGRFRLVRELGRGGSGIVYLAEDPQLGREVALKIPRPEVLIHADLRERFLREGHAAAALDHPNVVTVHEAAEVKPLCYIASAYCPGPTLAAWLKSRTQPVPPRQAARLVALLADALHHAHSRGILHRDLKPANVLLQIADCGPRIERPAIDQGVPTAGFDLQAAIPKITDFGLAKIMEAGGEDTVTGAILGTPSYMAPEQAAGQSRQVGIVTDIYGLGAILYELLTLQPPFRAESRQLTLEQVRTLPPVSPRSLQPRLPRDLETICLKCLAKDPARRYPSAERLAADLGHFLEGEPIEARAAGTWERLGRWSRRRPVAAAALGVAAVATLGLAVMWLLLTLQLQTERDAAARSAAEADNQRTLAEVERARAESNQERALAAIDRFLARVGDRRLADIPEMEEVRRELLQDALDFCQGLLAQSPNPDPIVRYQTGCAHGRMAKILHSLARLEPAEQHYLSALALLEKLAEDFPDNPAYRHDLAKNYHNLANLYRGTGRGSKCETLLLKSQEIKERLVRDNPRSVDYRRDLANTCQTLASSRLGSGHTREAEDLLTRALAIRAQLLEELPDDADLQASICRNHSAMGKLLFDTKRVPEAESYFRQALDSYQKIVQAHPQSTGFLEEMANAANSLGVTREILGRPVEAAAVYRDCIAAKQKLADKHPANPNYQFSLAWSYTNLGSAYLKGGRLDEAEEAYRLGRKLLELLARDHPRTGPYLLQMAKSDEGLASLQLTKGLLAEAESGFRSAAAILEPLVGQESEADLYVVDLALAYTHIGMVCTDRDDPQGALPWFERAFSCLNTVLKKKPRHTMALEFANEAHVGKALALTALGRYDLARPDWEEAFSTRRDALVTNHYAVWQALCSTTHRQFAEALSQARRLDKTALVSGDLPLIYQLAQVYALTADGMARPVQPSSQQHSAGESESCARRAIELLEFLRAQNFFTKKTRRTLFQSDRAFACLRTRADFVSLAFEPGSETR